MLTIDAHVSPVGLCEHFQYAPGRAGRDALHVHGDVQVCHSLNFAGRYRSGRFTADVPAGAVSIVDAWEPHAAEDPVDRPFVAHYHVLYVPKVLWDTVAAEDDLEPRVGIVVRRHAAARSALSRLYAGAIEGDSRMAHDERLGAVMAAVLRRRRSSLSVPLDSRRLARAREFIRAHLTTGVSLAEAAREADLSPQHFAASFRARYGLPPHRFQTLLRLDMARAHLAAGMPAADVAARCGFSDQSHFIRHFKRYAGMVPSSYRSKPPAL